MSEHANGVPDFMLKEVGAAEERVVAVRRIRPEHHQSRSGLIVREGAVNTTTAGSEASPENPIAGAELDGEIVFDLVYRPVETRLLADAREAGCLTIGGLEMLVAQAERQFELWTGQRPPAGLFQSRAALALHAEPAAAHHRTV